jgi:hypothetical protein
MGLCARLSSCASDGDDKTQNPRHGWLLAFLHFAFLARPGVTVKAG